MAAPEALWWKFAAGSGSHLIRVKYPGTDVQEVMLDGAPIEAPPGTLTFTGPAATLLELQDRGYGQWALLADGAEVSPYVPETASAASQICWWKFALGGTGTHHVRVKDIGTHAQQVWLDGAPLEAPPGTMTFTGPAASLLELVQKDGTWILVADGYPLHQQNPAADSTAPNLCWEFDLETGHHTLAARCINQSGQQLFLDGIEIQAPAGSLAFTGPGGSLLELRQAEDGAWYLFLEGDSLGPGLAGGFEAGDAPMEAYFEFVVPSTGSSHVLQVSNVGRQGQLVWIDGAHLDAPDGTLMFTGPAGCLLELKLQDNRWMLYVDGTCVSLPDSGGPRPPVYTGGSLPQGVSIDPETKKYTATIRVGGRFKNLGSFNTPEEASRRYQEAKAA